MAAPTVEAEFSVMHVIRSVTVTAAITEFHLSRKRLPMTGLTRDGRVRAEQRECCHLIVVEAPALPVDRRVAAPAILGETTLMPVVLLVARSAVGGCVPKSLSLVAGRALCLGVFAEQREPRKVVIEKYPFGPCRLAMTVGTCGTLGSLVRIVFGVAVVALHGKRNLEDGLDVTELALEFPVRPAQHIVGIRIVIENAACPVVSAVAGLAGFAEVTFVIVILEVTGNAGRLQLVGEWILAVTIVASNFRVPSGQQKVRVSCVIEGRIEPVGGLMAVAALGAAAAIMRVVIGMTVVAGCGRLQECLIFVTVQTCRCQVFAEQWVAGAAVIEFDIEPAAWRMTVGTLGAHGFAVNVVLFVTRKTRRRRIPVLVFSLVTVRTLRLHVLPVQREIGQRVVKIGLVETNNVRVATFMVRVAVSAFSCACISGQTVKPALCVKIAGNVFMAVKAKLTLFTAFKFLVAVAAFRLEVRVPGNDLAGHDERFYLRPCVLLRCQKQHKKESGYYRCLSHRP